MSSSLFIQSNAVVNLTENNITLGQADSGKIFLLPNLATAGADRTITLPDLADVEGVHYVFLNKALAVAHDWIITSGGNNNTGTISSVGNTVVTAAHASGNINFIGGTSVIGDFVEVYSAGTKWSVKAFSGVAGGITAA